MKQPRKRGEGPPRAHSGSNAYREEEGSDEEGAISLNAIKNKYKSGHVPNKGWFLLCALLKGERNGMGLIILQVGQFIRQMRKVQILKLGEEGKVINPKFLRFPNQVKKVNKFFKVRVWFFVSNKQIFICKIVCLNITVLVLLRIHIIT